MDINLKDKILINIYWLFIVLSCVVLINMFFKVSMTPHILIVMGFIIFFCGLTSISDDSVKLNENNVYMLATLLLYNSFLFSVICFNLGRIVVKYLV